MTTIPSDAPIFVAGHRGLVGSALLRKLTAEGYTNLLTAGRQELDLRDQAAVMAWFAAHRPQFVFLVAGTVGGIMANVTRPAEFLYDNMMSHATVVHAAHVCGTEKLLYLGSSCAHPRLAHQPMTEDQLLQGPLEPTNEYYDARRPDGMPVKIVEVTALAALGWTPRTPFRDGVRATYAAFVAQRPGELRGMEAAHPV